MNNRSEQQSLEDAFGQRSLADGPLKHLIESIPDAVLIADAAGQIVFVNGQAEAMFGYKRDDMAGKPLSILIPERLHAAHAKHIANFHAAPQARPMGLEKADLMGVRSDGTEFPVDVSLSFFETATGTVAFAAVRDITEKEESALALRRSEERYRDYYELAPIAYLSIEPRSGEILECNETTAKLLRLPKAAIIGKSSTQFYTEKSTQVSIVARRQLYKEGQVRNVELQIRRNDGTLIDISLDSIAVHGTNGRVLGSRTTWRDITDQKRAQQALEKSEEKYRSIFENVQDLIYQTNEAGIITEISPSVERYGYSQAGLIGTSVLDVYEEPEQRAEVIKAMLEEGELSDYELRLKTGDGRVVDFSLNARAHLDSDGKLTRTEGVLRDISDRKRMEEALEKTLLSERERARRDPLTGILNHAAIVERLREVTLDLTEHASHAIAMVDVDGLKAINDTFGHITGDEVLVAVARTLSRAGAEVGRYGGDEFVVILGGADREAAERYQDQVMAGLKSRSVSDPESGVTVPITVSFGFSIFPEDAGSVEDIIETSDAAMYAAKRQRPLTTDGDATPAVMGGEQASRMIGQIVPLLTTPGDLDEKLRRAAQRLSAIAGYDAVDFTFFAPKPGTPVAQETFANIDDDLLEAWVKEQRNDGDEPHPMRVLLERSQRPVIIDNIEVDERLTTPQRAVLVAAGIRSGLVVPMLWHGRLIGATSVGSKQPAAFSARDAQYLGTVAAQITAIMQMETVVDELQTATLKLGRAHEDTVMLLAAAAEAHDHTTGLHLQGVRSLTEALARELGYSDNDVTEIGLASVLHDIGKVRVADAILSDPGKLAGAQWDIMKQHTIWGASFLAGREGFELAVRIARSHHERWDGSGYPDGLAGADIPEPATVVSVADAFDAMTQARPYRAAQSELEAVREITTNAGTQFSPKVVAALTRLRAMNLPLVAHKSTEVDAA